MQFDTKVAKVTLSWGKARQPSLGKLETGRGPDAS